MFETIKTSKREVLENVSVTKWVTGWVGYKNFRKELSEPVYITAHLGHGAAAG